MTTNKREGTRMKNGRNCSKNGREWCTTSGRDEEDDWGWVGHPESRDHLGTYFSTFNLFNFAYVIF